MDLFEILGSEPLNLLPFDACVYYYGSIMPLAEADAYFQKLLGSIDWKPDVALIQGENFSKEVITKRKIAWYGDKAFSYTYSNTSKTAQPWTQELLLLKNRIEQYLAERNSVETFNSCLLNLYHDGSEGMSWHSDAERDLKRNGAIASLSLGAERKFSFKHKQNKQTVTCHLQHGSLLVMAGVTQTHWLHALPATQKVSQPRVNLTFRTIVE